MKIIKPSLLRVAYFFNEIGAGNTIVDKSGNGKTLTLNGTGPTLIGGPGGKAAVFDQNTLTYGTTPAIQISGYNGMTVMFRVYPLIGQLGQQKLEIASQRIIGDGSSSQFMINNGYTYTSQFLPFFFGKTPTPYPPEANKVFFQEATWVRGAVTCPYASGAAVNIYKNGALHDTYSPSGNLRWMDAYNSTVNMYVGADIGGYNVQQMGARLDYLLIWDTELTAKEIAVMDKRLASRSGGLM